jgi:hypothetical protein
MIFRYRQLRSGAVAALVGAAVSCGQFGRVEQGVAIDYDAAAGVVTLILESAPGESRYDVLPPVRVRIPEDPRQMGPAPAAGKLLRLGGGELAIFNAVEQRIETIPYRLVEKTGNVYPDDPRLARESLPAVDRTKGTVRLYSPKTREILTLSVPAQYLALPPDTWRFGDEVRYYFKTPGQALRMMNVSRTRLS